MTKDNTKASCHKPSDLGGVHVTGVWVYNLLTPEVLASFLSTYFITVHSSGLDDWQFFHWTLPQCCPSHVCATAVLSNC